MIFGIGLSRTGTTSLHHALELLGYRSAPSSAALLDDQYDRLLDRYDAFTDNPIPFMYRDLDARYPGSKFILTTRPLAGWLASMEWLFDEGLLHHRRGAQTEVDRMALKSVRAHGSLPLVTPSSSPPARIRHSSANGVSNVGFSRSASCWFR